MKEWIARLDQREQLSLLVLGVVLLLYILYALVWSPLDNMRDQLRRQNEAIVESSLRVNAMVSQVAQLRQGGAKGEAKPGAGRNLTTVINESTGRFNLPVIRLQPNSRGEIQVRLENASFNSVMQWLHEIEYGKGLLVREVSVTQAGTAGHVNVTVQVAEAG